MLLSSFCSDDYCGGCNAVWTLYGTEVTSDCHKGQWDHCDVLMKHPVCSHFAIWQRTGSYVCMYIATLVKFLRWLGVHFLGRIGWRPTDPREQHKSRNSGGLARQPMADSVCLAPIPTARCSCSMQTVRIQQGHCSSNGGVRATHGKPHPSVQRVFWWGDKDTGL